MKLCGEWRMKYFRIRLAAATSGEEVGRQVERRVAPPVALGLHKYLE